jgi:alkanesulfonate monooxygenase SsuD/methylene tetrahydromethanopterin reductase-like flavin-dependent oxidoreductase (luciferase family)
VGAEDVSASAFWSSHGIAYPDAGERVARLEETVDIVRALWRGEAVDHAGRFYTLRAARLQPPPVQRPGPPIWIAAMGSRALAVAATRADGWEASYLTPAAFDGAWTRLGALVERAGRSRGEMRRSVELDVVVGRSARDVGEARRRFGEGRRLDPRHPLLEAALVGTPAEVVDEIGRYAAAGATDLMLGFADFPGTDMLQVFAEEVMPHLAALARPIGPEP